MDSILSQERDHAKGLFALPQSNPYRSSKFDDSFLPRSFQQQPLAMDSPLPSHFAVWPPTPRNSESRPAASDVHYPFSMSEDSSINGATSSSWDEHSVNSQMSSNGVDIPSPHQYGSQLEADDWRPRADYSMLGGSLDNNNNNNNDNEGSSYGSSNGNGFLPVPNYYAVPGGLKLDTDLDPRRLSDELSSAEAATASTASYYGDDGSFIADYRTPLMSAATTPLSPSVRSVSRGRRSASPSRSSFYRVSPYSATDKKRWSAPGDSTGYFNLNLDPKLQAPQFHSHRSSPICAPQHSVQPYLPSHTHSQSIASFLPSAFDHHDVPQQQLLASQFYIPSQCHAEHHGSHYTEYSERPDLYSSLAEEPIPPPESDMNPEDPEMVPHEQDMRFEGDLYTPRWVRGHGNKREGWCGVCKPGRWLVLKNSAFWYDKSFTHGISAATGLRFNQPREMRRMDGNPEVWEGLCHSCNDWVPLVSNKKKGTTWFRHAYKCHTHNKVRDAPKRRRESSHGKAIGARAAVESL